MSFVSQPFFLFLSLVLLVYHLLRERRHKYTFLLLASWGFYASWSPALLWVLLFVTVASYTSGLRIETATTPGRRRCWLGFGILANLGLLIFFKYTPFLIHSSLALGRWFGWSLPDWTVEIALPLGISFFTFQGLSYVLDVYHGRHIAVRSFLDFALFKAFFPQLVVGPIVRAGQFLPQMQTPPRVGSRQVLEGLHWVLLGMFKKVFLADRLGQFVDLVFANPAAFDAITQRWAVLAYAGQIYCDFSGYSDIALGCAKWFGFELPINFRFPYLAGNISEFWKRWHISLSSWLRDYVYIGLGGSRRGAARTYFNLLVTMTLCGLWHGASWNYILWGFFNGILLSLHRMYDRALEGQAWAERMRGSVFYRATAVACTLLSVAMGLVMLRSTSWHDCCLVERSLLGGTASGMFATPVWALLLLALGATGHILSSRSSVRCRILQLSALPRALVYTIVVVLLVVFGPRQTAPFIYFQF
jgi:alginate O-acetyltransferase complex protein AlgI